MRVIRRPRCVVKQPHRGPLPYVKCPSVTEAYDEFIRTGVFSFGMSSDSEYDGKDNLKKFDLDSVVPNQDLLKAAAVAGRTEGQKQTNNESPVSTPAAVSSAPQDSPGE